MGESVHDLVAFAQRAQRSDTPHHELARLLPRLRGIAGVDPDSQAVERLIAAATEIATQQDWAAEMQLGAEGFDNTEHARAYRDVRECLVAAGRQLARACEVLLAHR